MTEHGHDHSHAPITNGDEPAAALRVRALEALLLEKGVIGREDVRERIDALVSRSPADGARLVARAWVDPKFKQRLLADARAAALELGLDPGPSPVVVAVENTQDVHHMVVCTLCSCYPKGLLGPPPDWYKSFPYRSRAVSDPRGVLKEFGVELEELRAGKLQREPLGVVAGGAAGHREHRRLVEVLLRPVVDVIQLPPRLVHDAERDTGGKQPGAGLRLHLDRDAEDAAELDEQ